MPTNADLRKVLDRRNSSMQHEWQDVEMYFRELRHWMMPRRGRFDKSANNEAGKAYRNKQIIDTTARQGLRTMETGMHAGITSPSRRFFKLGVMDKAAMEEREVRQWLSLVEDRMYDVLRVSNLYRMFPLCFRDLGLYGHHHNLIVPDFDTVVHSEMFTVGEYYLADDTKNRVTTSHRHMLMSTEKIVGKFGYENCPFAIQDDYKNDRPQTKHRVHSAIEPRKDRDPSSPLLTNAPFGVYHWTETGETDHLLSVSGYAINRIVAPRWDSEPGEIYSHSPAMDALGDAGTLQQLHVDKATAIQKSHKPPLQAPASMKKNRARHFPGGISYVDTSDLNKGGMRPVYEVKPDISGLLEDIHETQERIREAFFVDLFQMFTTMDRRQITAEEISRRYEEKVIMLGPTLERLDNELLGVVVDIIFYDMLDGGLIPPAPEMIAGQGLQVEYVSMLHQAQKAIGIQVLERTIGFVGTLGQIKPESIDKIDADKMVDEFALQVGIKPDIIIDTKKLEAKRKQDAQAAQMAAEAPVAESMANSAKLLSEAGARGNNPPAPGGTVL